MRQLWQITAAALVAVWASSGTQAQSLDSDAGSLRIQQMVGGLSEPWSLGFLPGGGLIITERGGRLLVVEGGASRSIAGVPKVAASGQGGLLDVLVPNDFAQTREIYLSFAKPQSGGGAGTAVARAVLSQSATRLEDVRTIFEMTPGASGGRHFGSRLVEGRDGMIYVTIGERGDRPAAQDLSRHEGSVVRIARDGSVPADNPFVGHSGAQPEIWSIGHRNPQGAALDANGRLWVAEHGARGGDEVNLVKKGQNYGWPVISYGRHYSGARIGKGTAQAGMQQPAHYWDPSIAPSGMAIYSGKLWPEWRGDFFVGSLKFSLISRIDGDTMAEAEQIEGPQTARVRDVREGPDGAIWFISENNGAVYRMTPG
ncbi:PQQ-dependent sugar dehydrogenase [Meridianimarinicoccus aquatilis]|uniref:PQQ-dependent sugar dehydrogenase n=1 Tax=Meridianimarinicoccus aquatilis TaxID=2552766 RepID=A0A4R6AYL5_9RHOB|nr:PQQ-dependent sugar dehydrogenase [Fluviibacterium aquatile]TDL87958.1 PQQ-dependent sugar dehydrogenase [Fluviibacterium aquatile]